MADMDMRAAESTYDGFISLLKWGTVATIAVAAFVIMIIS